MSKFCTQIEQLKTKQYNININMQTSLFHREHPPINLSFFSLSNHTFIQFIECMQHNIYVPTKCLHPTVIDKVHKAQNPLTVGINVTYSIHCNFHWRQLYNKRHSETQQQSRWMAAVKLSTVDHKLQCCHEVVMLKDWRTCTNGDCFMKDVADQGYEAD